MFWKKKPNVQKTVKVLNALKLFEQKKVVRLNYVTKVATVNKPALDAILELSNKTTLNDFAHACAMKIYLARSEKKLLKKGEAVDVTLVDLEGNEVMKYTVK